MLDPLTDGFGDCWPVDVPDAVLDGLTPEQRHAFSEVWRTANAAQRSALLMAPALPRAQYLSRVARIIATGQRAFRRAAERFAEDTTLVWALEEAEAPSEPPAPVVRTRAPLPRRVLRRRPPLS